MKKAKEKKIGIAVQIVFTLLVLISWEILARAQIFGPRSALVFPTIEAIAKAFVRNFVKGYGGVSLWKYVLNSLKLLMTGLFAGIVLAFLLSGLAILCRPFYHIYNLMVSVCDLLPGVALLPVVIVIFGVNPGVIIFLVIHAALWPMSRSVLDGFMAVPPIYVEAGQNIGLKGPSLLVGVYLPATMPYIISGLKGGWARAWRGLISAEMIFGIATCPGIGLFINQMRTNMNNEEMYATLVVIVIIGVLVQYGILTPLENATIRKWGMSR